MKMKTIFFLITALFCFVIAANAQKPFKELGLDSEISLVTLSNGRYAEYFDNDTLRQIGSVIFNTITHKVEYFIPQDDTSRQQIAKRSKETSRFLSPDPNKNEFAFQSPYLFASNNPIKFIDYQGGFTLDATFKEKYPKVALIIENADKLYNNQELPADVKEALKGVDVQKVFNEYFKPALEEYSTLSNTAIQDALKPGSGPQIVDKDLRRVNEQGEIVLVNGKNQTVLDKNGNATNQNQKQERK